MASTVHHPIRVFLSYLHENTEVVDRLVRDLERHHLNPRYDRNTLKPGMFWKDEIRKAIRAGDFFIACISREYRLRERTYMSEELEVAFEELRQRPNTTWFIPVLLSGAMPDIPISSNKKLDDIQYIDFNSVPWDGAIAALVEVITTNVEAREANRRALLEEVMRPVERQPTSRSSVGLERNIFEHPRDDAFAVAPVGYRGDLP